MLEGKSLGNFDHVQTLMTRSVWHGQYTWWTLNASSVSACDQSCPGSPPPTFKHIFRVYKIIMHIKQSGGGELEDKARVTKAKQCRTVP